MKRVENMAQTQYSALQKQYESLRQFNDNLHEKSVGNLKSEYLAARDGERKAEDEAREALVKARKAESIAQIRDQQAEQLQSACDTLRSHRNEAQGELAELTDRYDAVNDQSVVPPKFGDVTTPISRKEAETTSVPSWPKIDQLDTWKGKLLWWP